MDLPKGQHLLIDADILRYRCAFAAEKTHYCVTVDNGYEDWFTEFETSKEADAYIKDNSAEGVKLKKWSRKEVQPVEFALQAIKTVLEALWERHEPSGVSLFLTGEGNFRERVAVTKPYKGNRDATHKPVYYKEAGDYLVNHWNAVTIDGYEADDAIGWASTDLGSKCIIVSTDKDLDQLPGWHYNWVKGEGYSVTRKMADWMFYTQLLTGDPVDNVPGISGVGIKTAQQILEGSKNSRDLCERVWAVYKDRYKSPEAAKVYLMEQATLLYIQKKKDEAWVPPIELE